MPENRPPLGITRNQFVTSKKVRFSRELRQRMTPAESVVWNAVRNKQLDGYKFRRQQIIDGFIADFYCEKAALVLEIDGSAHDSPESQAYDRRREDVFKRKGLTVLRLSNEEVLADESKVAEKIREKMRLI